MLFQYTLETDERTVIQCYLQLSRERTEGVNPSNGEMQAVRYLLKAPGKKV
jgi:hypothetical protein